MYAQMNSKGWKGKLLLILVLLVSMTMVVGCSGDAGDDGDSNDVAGNGDRTIQIGMVNWAEAVAVSNLWKVILEEEGYEVELTQLDAAPLYVGLSSGDLDLFFDSWLPVTHETYWNEYKDSLDDYGIWYEKDAKIGIAVPQYVTIDSIEDLKSKKDEFNGEIIGIDPGAGIMQASNVANEDYELGFEIIQGSEAAMMAAMEKAYQKEEWIAITGWSPHWVFAKYDLKYLDDPKLSYGEAEQIHTLANKNFTTEFPDVANMLKSFTMSDEQIGSLEALIVDGLDPLEAAKTWKADNEEVVNSWLK